MNKSVRNRRIAYLKQQINSGDDFLMTDLEMMACAFKVAAEEFKADDVVEQLVCAIKVFRTLGWSDSRIKQAGDSVIAMQKN